MLRRDRRALLGEHLLLRQHLAVARRARPRPRLRRRDRLCWTVVRRVCAEWRRHLVLGRPETGLRWPRRGWRSVWGWRALIASSSRDNPLWGTERSRGGLRELGLAVSTCSVQRDRCRGPARPPSQTWRTFLRIHAGAIWAADLLTVRTLTFTVLYLLVVITHGRRELVRVNVTAHPAAAWVWRQVVEATARGRRPRFLLRDRDAVCGSDFAKRTEARGVETRPTPVRAPQANAVAERAIRTLRQECLDQMIPLDERHLRTSLAE